MTATLPMAVWLAPALATGGAVLALVADATGRRRLAAWLAVLGLASASAAGFWQASAGSDALAFGTFASGAGFSGLPALGYALAACALVAGHRELVARDRGTATATIIAIGAVFSHALLASLDVVVTFVALAGLAVVGYALAAASGTKRAEEAAVRYLVQGVVASALAVLGLGIVFAVSGGLTGYREVGAALTTGGGRPALLAFGLLSAAFAFKLGAFPFHAWVPDVYENADESAIAFLASVPKIAGAVALLVIVRGTVFATAVPDRALSGVVLFLALGSMLFGAFGMVRQRSVGRLLGYSAIAQAGYAATGIATGEVGVRATVLFIATYAVGVCAAFAALAAVRRVRPWWDGTLEGLAGLSRRSPVLAASLAVSMFSLTGIPLFAGFWGKLLILVSAVDAGQVWLALVAGLSAVVAFAGYGSVIRAAYFESADAPSPLAGDVSPDVEGDSAHDERGGASTGLAAVLAVVLIAAGLIPLVWGVGALYALFAVG